jgi:hypothetical protein
MEELPPKVERHYTLQEAIEHFFPGGYITGASLRTEIRKGRLRATEVAGKLLVSESAIARCLNDVASYQATPSGSILVWIIRDGENRTSTGCRVGVDDKQAQRKLADYINAKYQPGQGRDPAHRRNRGSVPQGLRDAFVFTAIPFGYGKTNFKMVVRKKAGAHNRRQLPQVRDVAHWASRARAQHFRPDCAA